MEFFIKKILFILKLNLYFAYGLFLYSLYYLNYNILYIVRNNRTGIRIIIKINQLIKCMDGIQN